MSFKGISTPVCPVPKCFMKQPHPPVLIWRHWPGPPHSKNTLASFYVIVCSSLLSHCKAHPNSYTKQSQTTRGGGLHFSSNLHICRVNTFQIFSPKLCWDFRLLPVLPFWGFCPKSHCSVYRTPDLRKRRGNTATGMRGSVERGGGGTFFTGSEG